MSNRPNFIREQVVVAPFTTFKIGGPAKYFAEPTTIEEIQLAVRWAIAEGLPIRCIGRGANLLVADQGFSGLVLVLKNDEMAWTPPTAIIGAGVQNGQCIAGALQHEYGGLQWLIGVPGTIGGSLYGNAGGHGWGLGDQVDWVEYLDEQGNIVRRDHEACQFTYRSSIFKQHPAWIILRAQLHFRPVDPAAERALLAATTKQKNANQPTTAKTAGCMFTNPVADINRLPNELRPFVGADGTISAWRLIEAVGLKGYTLGQVQISDRHANFMINLGGATADHVMQLVSLVKQRVRDTLGVQLHEEVQFLGF